MVIGDNQQEGTTLWLFAWFRRFRWEAAEPTCSAQTGTVLGSRSQSAWRPRPARTASQASKRRDGTGAMWVENTFKGPAPVQGLPRPLRCSHAATQAWRWWGEVVQLRQLIQEFVHGAPPRVGGGRWNGGIPGCGTKLAEVAGRTVAGRRPGAPAERGQGSRTTLGHRQAIAPMLFGASRALRNRLSAGLFQKVPYLPELTGFRQPVTMTLMQRCRPTGRD